MDILVQPLRVRENKELRYGIQMKANFASPRTTKSVVENPCITYTRNGVWYCHVVYIVYWNYRSAVTLNVRHFTAHDL